MNNHLYYHKIFITKYLFWNRIQEITKVWSYMVFADRNFKLLGMNKINTTAYHRRQKRLTEI